MSDSSTIVRLSDARVDLARGTVHGPVGEVRLTTTELALLAYLVANPSRTLRREDLHRDVWGFSEHVVTRACDVTMRRLRIKVEATPAQPRHLITVHGAGYRFEPLLDRSGPSPSGAHRSLPVPAVRARGRGPLLDALVAACAPGTLHTLVGPPGVGKTTVAVELVHRRPNVWFADLRSAVDAADLCSVVARSVGGLVGRGDPVATVATLLACQPSGTLILDEFEHLLIHRDLVAHWQDVSPQLCLVVTSRVPLAIPGERRWPVEPLGTEGPESDAVAVYLDAAERVAAQVSYPLDAVVSLVQRLEGLPLAVALAASRSWVLPAAELASRPDVDGRLLRDPARSGRHQSLELALEASWVLLSPAEQQALAQCSVFRDGFTLAAAEAVIDVGPDEVAVDVVQTLAEHSLLTTTLDDEGTLRLGMLSAVRAFVARRDIEPCATARRHRRYYATLLPSTLPPYPPGHGGGVQAARELANLQAAVESAIAEGDGPAAQGCYASIWRALVVANRSRVLVGLGERIVALPVSPTDAIRHRVRLSDALYRGSDWTQAAGHMALVDRMMPGALSASEQSTVHHFASVVGSSVGWTLDRVEACLLAAATCARAGELASAVATYETRLALVRLRRGDAEAWDDLDRHADAMVRAGSLHRAARARALAVPALCRLGQLEHGLQVLDEVIPDLTGTRAGADLDYARSLRAVVLALRDDWQGAAHALDTLLTERQSDGADTHLGPSRLRRALIARWLGDDATAIRCLDRELLAAQQSQQPFRLASVHLQLAANFAEIAEPRRAQRHLRSCDDACADGVLQPRVLSTIAAWRGLVLARLGRGSEATATLDGCRFPEDEVPAEGHEVYLIARAVVAAATPGPHAARDWLGAIRCPHELFSLREARRLLPGHEPRRMSASPLDPTPAVR